MIPRCRAMYIGIGVAAVANVVVGMLWYSPWLLGTMYQEYMAAMGITPDMSKMLMATIGSFIAALVIAAGMGCFMARLAITSIERGAVFGALSWLTFVAPVTVQGVLYAQWPVALYLINNGYNLVSLIVMGVILSQAIRRCEI